MKLFNKEQYEEEHKKLVLAIQKNKKAFIKNKEVFTKNKEVTDKSIKTLGDVIAAMERINAKYDIPITNIRTIDDVKKCMEQTEKKWDNGKK